MPCRGNETSLRPHQLEKYWGDSQQRAFKEIKELLNFSKVLVRYDPIFEGESADASLCVLSTIIMRQRMPNGELYTARCMHLKNPYRDRAETCPN